MAFDLQKTYGPGQKVKVKIVSTTEEDHLIDEVYATTETSGYVLDNGNKVTDDDIVGVADGE